MTYRDEQQALRARLEATEQRLRETENELAEAKRLLEEGPSVFEPSTAPPPSRRVGHPPPPPPGASLARTLAGSGGAVLTLFGIGFMLWNLPGAGLLDMAMTMFFSALLFLGPGGLFVWLSLRQTAKRHHPAVPSIALRRERVTTRIGEVELATEADADADADADAEEAAVVEAKAR